VDVEEQLHGGGVHANNVMIEEESVVNVKF